MNTPEVRPLLSPPQLPRITSRDHPAEPEGGSARPMPRRSVEAMERRQTTWKGESPSSSRPSTPVRESRPSGTRPAGATLSEKPPLPASRAATPAAAVARIVEAAAVARPRQGTVIRIALSPAHLGELVIELVLRDSRLYGKVLAETGSAKHLIENHLDDLRRGLERKGVEIGEFEVIVAEPDPAPPEEPSLRSVRRLVLDVLA